jgi:hypothetical protein
MIDVTWISELSSKQQQALLAGPALNPPQNVILNLLHPPNRNALGVSILITASVLALLLVACHTYFRVYYCKKFEAEDSKFVYSLS